MERNQRRIHEMTIPSTNFATTWKKAWTYWRCSDYTMWSSFYNNRSKLLCFRVEAKTSKNSASVERMNRKVVHSLNQFVVVVDPYEYPNRRKDTIPTSFRVRCSTSLYHAVMRDPIKILTPSVSGKLSCYTNKRTMMQTCSVISA